MALKQTIQSTLLRYSAEILVALRQAVLRASEAGSNSGVAGLQSFYGQMQYHLGWVDDTFSPVTSNPGKLLRPALLLLAYEAAGAAGLSQETWHSQQAPLHSGRSDEAASKPDYLRRALPAAAALELTHNFTLIHDDIEDGDTERRHRPTLWKLWGAPQAINTGDGMYALSRLALWEVVNEGVEAEIAMRLGALLDHTCLVISEGQHLDISFESSLDITVSMYIDMISRKTAALMRCAAEMGAILGTRDAETIERLRSFGYALGIAFQVRDDLLGVWASTAELGKTPAGDIYRRKKSLPVIYALEHASTQDLHFLRQVYRQEEPLISKQVEEILAVLARTQSQAYCSSFLAEQCRLAYDALANVPRNTHPVAARALHDMETLIHFVKSTSGD